MTGLISEVRFVAVTSKAGNVHKTKKEMVGLGNGG